MCLLDEVESWSESGIVCRTSSHRQACNPLRTDGTLGIANGIEYAAQAMAIHGALLSSGAATARVGFLTSVRDVQWTQMRLDNIEGFLSVRAELISGNNVNMLYSFGVQTEDSILLSGRASVMLNAEDR